MYENISDLPETLRKHMPEKLQKIYFEAYQKSWENYQDEEGGDLDRESVAHRDGMTAVQQDYVHDDDTGEWYPKGEEPEEATNGQEQIADEVEEVKKQLDDM